MLHKDIKPTNILIFDGPDGEPRPRLVDFGIGTLADPSVLGLHGVTSAGFTRATIQHSTGTPTYSPPEYLAGRPYTIQGDIYGLGVLLYQLITCKPLDPLAPGWERYIADPLLQEDITDCVDGDPARRLASAADLAERLHQLEKRRADIEELERLTRSEEARAKAEVEAAAARARAVRLRRLVVAFAALTLLALAAGALSWVFQKRATGARIRAESSEATALAQRDRASELLDFQAYSHALERGDLAMAYDRLGSAYARSPRWEYGLGFGRIAAAARASFVPVQRILCDEEPVRGAFCWIDDPGHSQTKDRALLVLAFAATMRAYDLADGGLVASHEFGEKCETISLQEIRTLGESGTSGVVAAFRDRPPLVLSLPDLGPVSQGPADMAGADVAVGRSASVAAAFRGRELVVFEPSTGTELKRKAFEPDLVDRIGKVSIQPNGQAISLTSLRLAPLRIWDWKEDRISSDRRMQGVDFASDDSLVGLWSWQQGGDFLQMMIQYREASGMCKLWFPTVQMGHLETRRIFDGKAPSPNFLVTLRDDSAVEFVHLSGNVTDGKWTGAVTERALASATGLFPHFPQTPPVELLATEPATQQLAIRCGDRVDILAPRGVLFGEKGVGVAGKGNLPAGMSSGRSTAALPCNYWAACQDGNTIWTVSESEVLYESSRVSNFSFAPDGWRVAKQDYQLMPPAGLGEKGAGFLVETAITKHRARNSLYILWDKVTTTLHTQESPSLDLMVARYDLPDKTKMRTGDARLEPAHEFRLSAHPRGGLREIREFFIDSTGEVLVCATENCAAGYALSDGKLLYKLPAANRFGVSPDRRYIALGDWRQDRKVEVRHTRSGKKIMETTELHTLKSIVFTPDGNHIAFGCKTGFMECFDVLTGSIIQRISTDLSPILLLSGGDRYLGMRMAAGKETGDVFLADRTNGLPINHVGYTHFLNHWYGNLDENLIFQVTKYEVALHRRSNPDHVRTWLDTLWPGGVVPRSQVLAGPESEEISRKFLIDDEIGRYRPAPGAPPP